MMVVVLVLILVVGPKDLPKVVRTIGQWTAKARRMSREFTSSLEDIGRETELEDLRRDLNSIGGSSVTSLDNHIDPDGSLKKSVQSDYADGKAGAITDESPSVALGIPAVVDRDNPLESPPTADVVADASERANAEIDASLTDQTADQTIESPAKAGASGA